MTFSRKRCRECGHLAADGWHISNEGRCRPCAAARAVAVINACFPPDPPPPGLEGICNCDYCRETGAVIPLPVTSVIT